MNTRVEITCKNGDMFAITQDQSLMETLEGLHQDLGRDGDGIMFGAFGRSHAISGDDVAEIRIKELG